MPYPTPHGVEAAIKAAAQRAAAADPSLNTNQRIRMAHFDRFLCRVFSEGARCEWLLKGGTAMLARVPSSRPTLDIDLYRGESDRDEALADLRRLAKVDLGDHFAFVYVGIRDAANGEAQPYTEGYHVTFDVLIGPKRMGRLGIDLIVGAGATSTATTTEPASRLDLPRLISNRYRLYPIVDQIADKVCATMTTYNDRASSREKDLVDLVICVMTQDVGGTSLRVAITTETRRRTMEPFDRFVVPSTWGVRYAKLGKSVPACADYPTVELAKQLVTRLVDPALRGEADGKTWDHQTLVWTG